MNLVVLNRQIENFKTNDQVISGLQYLLQEFELEHPNFGGFGFRNEQNSKSIVITTEGILGQKPIVKCPPNILDFDLILVLNLLLHEMTHVHQYQLENIVHDKNEREWQAYYEMIFHIKHPQIPMLSNYHQLYFAEKALVYYSRMGETSDLQKKYELQKLEIDALILKLRHA